MKIIDDDALLECIPNDLPYKSSVKRVLTQAPDLLRCKECKHYDELVYPDAHIAWVCNKNWREKEPDGFCDEGVPIE